MICCKYYESVYIVVAGRVYYFADPMLFVDPFAQKTENGTKHFKIRKRTQEKGGYAYNGRTRLYFCGGFFNFIAM